MRKLLILGASLIVVSIGIVGSVLFLNSQKRNETIVFARNSILNDLWETAKMTQIESGSGRTVDAARDNATTSEGESYTLLRSVWIDDRKTFDASWKWTKGNLQRSSDSLFSSQYGKKADGSYGILASVGGQNTTSGADSDIALALVMASYRWHDQTYLDTAKPIISSIWSQEVVTAGGKPILSASDTQKAGTGAMYVNPSYFSPYAAKVFAKIDMSHDWTALASNEYTVLDQAVSAPLDKTTSAGLVPDWIQMNRTTGAISATGATNLDTNFGYDAMRVPFRLALDYNWYKDPRDKEILQKMTSLQTSYTNYGSLASVYSHDGQTVTSDESPAVYGGTIGYFMVINPTQAAIINTQKLTNLYDPNGQNWKHSLNYYDDNWAWFGIALYSNALPNLTMIN